MYPDTYADAYVDKYSKDNQLCTEDNIHFMM
jgi:hypothetical protein